MTAQMSYYVDAPVGKVFDYFLDPAKQATVSSPFGDFAVGEHRLTADGVGTYMSWTFTLMGIPLSGFDVITECVRDKHITERSSNALVGTWTYDFAPEGTGTRLTMTHHQESVWALPLISTVTDRLTRRMSEAYIGALKTRVEATTPKGGHTKTAPKRRTAA